LGLSGAIQPADLSSELSQTMPVLVAEDNPVFQSMLRSMLTKWGYDVRISKNGLEAWEAIQAAGAPRLAVLDWMMPYMDGVEVCRRIRTAAREPYVYVLLLTARTESQDLVEGMEAGADDYITKPIRFRELVARLRAVLRRSRLAEDCEPTLLQAGELELDVDRRVLLRNGEIVHLTPTEFDLLAMLMRHQDIPVPHAKLLRSIWGPEYGAELEYLRSFVKTLRKKVEEDPAKPRYIVTEPWVGYRFRKPTDGPSAAPLTLSI